MQVANAKRHAIENIIQVLIRHARYSGVDNVLNRHIHLIT